jgi:hypothetical protein
MWDKALVSSAKSCWNDLFQCLIAEAGPCIDEAAFLYFLNIHDLFYKELENKRNSQIEFAKVISPLVLCITILEVFAKKAVDTSNRSTFPFSQVENCH